MSYTAFSIHTKEVDADGDEVRLTVSVKNIGGFDGVVMTDWFATGNKLGSHALALAAGDDLIMPGGNGAEISETDVKRYATNVLRGILTSRIYQAYKKSKDKR